MQKESLRVMDHLIREKTSRENRLTELIKDPEKNHVDDWFMCVPPCFNDALDIKRTERVESQKKTTRWTQGSSFSFKPGDVIYDTPHAYETWAEALKQMHLCVQVKQATSSGPSEGSEGRLSGAVTFSILIPNKSRTTVVTIGEHTMSQDAFVRFLIVGPDKELQEKIGKTHTSDVIVANRAETSRWT